jgi:Tol biopolymer transport system component
MSAQDGTNQLMVADADGKNPQPLVLSGSGAPNIIDAPLFLPDGKSLLFSAPVQVTSSIQPWYERLFGTLVAQAHTVPSDWFRTVLTGGPADRLTHLQAPGLFASLSPDKTHIASYSTGGIFVMAPDGSGVTMILNDVGGIYGTVNWIR